LNIGGEISHVSRLAAWKSIFLKNLFENVSYSTQEEVFIERGKGAIIHILHWLRKGMIYLEKGALRNLRDKVVF
jgi:hypothetical protein